MSSSLYCNKSIRDIPIAIVTQRRRFYCGWL